jgi:aminodeoxyfutalosine synthase
MDTLQTISTEDARSLLETQNLVTVGMRGDEVRRAMHGARTTFGRVLEVHVDAMPSALPAGEAGGELRIIGRPASAESALAAVDALVALGEGGIERRPLTGFSLADLLGLVSSLEELKALCRTLRGRGLEAVAEAPLDLLDDAAGAIAAAREGQLAVWRLTVHELPEETTGVEERIALVERARDLQTAVGGLRAFAPLPRTMSVSSPTTGYDDVKLIALARVVVTSIPHIQVDWPIYGPKLAQVALTMGADDIDGVSAVDTGSLGTRRTPLEEIKNNVRAAALQALERDGRYHSLSNVPLT